MVGKRNRLVSGRSEPTVATRGIERRDPWKTVVGPINPRRGLCAARPPELKVIDGNER
jgi:hypothetical protein